MKSLPKEQKMNHNGKFISVHLDACSWVCQCRLVGMSAYFPSCCITVSTPGVELPATCRMASRGSWYLYLDSWPQDDRRRDARRRVAASCRMASRKSSSLDQEFVYGTVTAGVATLGVGLSATCRIPFRCSVCKIGLSICGLAVGIGFRSSCRMASRSSFSIDLYSSVGARTIGVAMLGVGSSVSSRLSSRCSFLQHSTFHLCRGGRRRGSVRRDVRRRFVNVASNGVPRLLFA